MATDTFTTDDTAEAPAPAVLGRSLRLLLFALALAAIGLIDHFVPLSAALRTQVGAVSMVWVCGLGVLTWLPKQRFDLTFSLVLAGGLSLGILAASVLLVVDAYSPDRAAVGAGATALLLLAARVIWRPEQ